MDQKIQTLEPRGARCDATLVTIHLQIKPCAQNIRLKPLILSMPSAIPPKEKSFPLPCIHPRSRGNLIGTDHPGDAEPWWS
jgi:hypothetical protein